MYPPPTYFPTHRFAALIEVLCKAVAARGGKCATPLPAPLVVWIWSRLRRIGVKVAALVARIEAGTYRPRRPSHHPSPAPLSPPPPRKPRQPPPLPLRSAWLCRMIQESRTSASHLRLMFAEHDMAALLAENRQLRRLLRPLCTMLGVQMPPLRVAPPDPPPEPPPALQADGATQTAAQPASPKRWLLLPPPAATTRPGGCGPPVPA